MTEHGIEKDRAADHAQIELAKLAAVIEVMDEKGIQQASVVAHSESAIYMAVAALLYPGRFKNMVFVEPAGMIGNDNIFRLAKGMIQEMTSRQPSDNLPSRSNLSKKELGDLRPLRVLGANLKRTWGSIRAIVSSDIVEIMKELKSRGVNISVVYGVDDKVFPMELLSKEVGPDTITGFYSVRGGHFEISDQSERYTKAIDQILETLEAKSQREVGA